MPLLERDGALASLAQYAQEARDGEGRLVLLAGEAGVGKSALLEQFQQDVRDARWIWGACDGLFTPRPLGPLFDFAGQLGEGLSNLCRAGAPREELFSALLRLINEPGVLTVVVVEDVHWADEATVDMLRFLGRRIRSAAVLLVATYRDDGLAAGDPLRVALGDLATQRSTRRIGLAPLSVTAVAKLAEGSGLDPVELHQLTCGNPFFITEVIRGGMDTVPVSARDAVLARAGRLTDKAREALEVAALAGTRVEVRLVEPITGCGPRIIDELLASGLLTDEGGGLRFRHEIARLAVAQAVPAHRHAAIHRRVFDALGQIGCADDARMAFYAEAAGDATAVLTYAVRAGRRSAELASHREAVAQFERALRFAADLDTQALATLYEDYAYEVSMLDRWEDAAAAGEHALRLWRGLGNQVRAGDTLRRLSRTMWRLCRGAEATAAAEAAVATLEPLGPGRELAWAYANLANQRMLARDNEATIELARLAMATAEPIGVPAVVSEATNSLACAVGAAGGDWTGDLRRALEIAIDHGLPAQAGRAYTNLYSSYCAQYRFAEAEQSFVEGYAYCDVQDMDVYTICLRGERTSMLAKIGRWDEAVALCTELLGRVASPINRINPLVSLGTVRARRGDDGVWDCLDEAASAADRCGEPEWIAATWLARTEARWLEGDQRGAAAELDHLVALLDRCDPWERGAIAVWLARTGSARTPRGELAEPYRLMVNGERSVAASHWLGLGAGFDAALALADGTDEAQLREAVRLFDGLGARPAARLARQKMRQLGMRSVPAGAHATTRANPAGLTRREREVLDLICVGQTNAEIAANLFISAKTVDHHVSAVLAKLGVPTRAVAAAEARRRGLVAAGR